MDACPHGFPKPANCVECMEDGNLPPAPQPEPRRTTSHPFTAGFPGHCTGCNLAIHERQLIVRMSDDTYRHADCGGAA